jgi:hypothetical protein
MAGWLVGRTRCRRKVYMGRAKRSGNRKKKGNNVEKEQSMRFGDGLSRVPRAGWMERGRFGQEEELTRKPT